LVRTQFSASTLSPTEHRGRAGFNSKETQIAQAGASRRRRCMQKVHRSSHPRRTRAV
jgi:hypothetical protein